jgi:hypothetical protein
MYDTRRSLAFDTCMLPRLYGGRLRDTDDLFAFRVFVDGRGRAEILEDLQSRIRVGDVKAEQTAAIKVTLA